MYILEFVACRFVVSIKHLRNSIDKAFLCYIINNNKALTPKFQGQLYESFCSIQFGWVSSPGFLINHLF